jgi:hypothetical protein
MDAEAIKATKHGFLCDSPCTPFHMHGECYCIETMRRHDAQELDDGSRSTQPRRAPSMASFRTPTSETKSR